MKSTAGFLDYLETCKSIGDVHTRRAMYEFNKTYDAVTKAERAEAKNCNFRLIYGFSPESTRFSNITGQAMRYSGVTTGRFGSKHPNISNIPKREPVRWWEFWKWFRRKPRLMLCFDKAQPGTEHSVYTLAQADFYAMELRIASHMASLQGHGRPGKCPAAEQEVTPKI